MVCVGEGVHGEGACFWEFDILNWHELRAPQVSCSSEKFIVLSIETMKKVEGKLI